MYEFKFSKEGPEGRGWVPGTKELIFEEPEMYTIEKNWMRFENGAGIPHYIRSLDPYMVMRDSSESRAPELMVHDRIALFRTLTKTKGLAVHGGSNPVLIQGRDPALAPYGRYFLGTMHTRDKRGRYLNYCFAFLPDRPFTVIAITAPLPLLPQSLERRFQVLKMSQETLYV